MVAEDLGIPIVSSYRYLGTVIDIALSSAPQIKLTTTGLDLTIQALSPLLSRDNLRFNINSFITFGLPRLMMIPTTADLSIQT